MLETIGTVCVVFALTLDTASYWKQIAKCVRTKKSTQVSSSQYLYKMAKAIFAMIGLAVYFNWVGFGIEVIMFLVYLGSLLVVAHYKPKNWRLWK